MRMENYRGTCTIRCFMTLADQATGEIIFVATHCNWLFFNQAQRKSNVMTILVQVR